jgi:CheY-like chemotaxis protein
VARIVGSIQGAVEVLDAPGGGAVFRVELPMSADHAQHALAEELPAVESLQLFVLLVEDDPAVREAMEGMLGALGHEVLAARDGVEALGLLASDKTVQVVVTDFQMPNLNGEGLVRAMRQRGDGRPVVMLSGYGSVLDPAKTDLASRVLAKPVRLDALQQALCEAVV